MWVRGHWAAVLGSGVMGSGVRSLLFTFLARRGRPQSAFADGRLKPALSGAAGVVERGGTTNPA